jgi:hypothetical protein
MDCAEVEENEFLLWSIGAMNVLFMAVVSRVCVWSTTNSQMLSLSFIIIQKHVLRKT